MTRLLLVLWASLVSVDLERGMIIYKVPAQNLTCFQCFNVSQASQCQPAECQPNEKVCVSREVLLNKNKNRNTEITKRCATTCPKANDFNQLSLSNIHDGIIRRCCSWDRCNRAPGSWEGFWSLPGWLLLPMSLALFCTLL
ncbi:lymphocyte antigen 6L isoform X1 [Mus musculus]|uniref:UPAR/Ly6 domain-containing protein n=1 Tax=Mus musculus TaxID=10090 RepID=A0ABA7IXG5_MOUSE|nr:Lymphocyte antigen 6L precursor [Mus musculus]XP_030104742.1 lymphocyte antigen 6L isoform X1 [Mus musculus]